MSKNGVRGAFLWNVATVGPSLLVLVIIMNVFRHDLEIIHSYLFIIFHFSIHCSVLDPVHRVWIQSRRKPQPYSKSIHRISHWNARFWVRRFSHLRLQTPSDGRDCWFTHRYCRCMYGCFLGAEVTFPTGCCFTHSKHCHSRVWGYQCLDNGRWIAVNVNC